MSKRKKLLGLLMAVGMLTSMCTTPVLAETTSILDEITEEEKALKKIGWIDAGASFYIILFSGLGLAIAGAYLFIPLMVVGMGMVFPIEIWTEKIGFKKWLKEAKKVVPDLEQRIMKDTEFAKSVDSAIIGHHSEMMKYITRLNPEAGKELQNIAGKKK